MDYLGDRHSLPSRATARDRPYYTTDRLAKPVYSRGDPLRSPWLRKSACKGRPYILSICSTLQGFEVGGIDFALAQFDELVNGEVFHACVMQCLDVGRVDVVFAQFDDLIQVEMVEAALMDSLDEGRVDLVFAQFDDFIDCEIGEPGIAQ